MIRLIGTIFAGFFGLAFGSFLNVCVSRWPEGESVVRPRSHCRLCDHALAWYENIPLLSWLVLRGRCRECHAWIGLRYPLLEATTGGLWALVAWRSATALFPIEAAVGLMFFLWVLLALAALDAEHLWLPNALTLPGTLLGVIWWYLQRLQSEFTLRIPLEIKAESMALAQRILGILVGASIILLIRWSYHFLRHHEGLGLGDAKLMAMLAAWLGMRGALLSFALGVFLAAGFAVFLLLRGGRTGKENWGNIKLPFGTFLCIGGMVSTLWERLIIAEYLRWCGF